MSHLRYLWYVLKHKWYVFLECMKWGVPLWGALIHDWQKFTSAEWGPYRRNFFIDWEGGKKPNWVKDQFRRAWSHHLCYGPHHWEYWIINDIILEMPDRYRREMLADWNSAGLAINGVNDTREFYEKRKGEIILHEETRKWIEEMMDKTPPKENDLVAELVMSLFPDGFKGVCIDVGAYHPTWLSNSYELEQSGWDVYCIEPNPYCIPDLLQGRKNVIQCAAGKENHEWVKFYIYRKGHGPNDMAGHTGLLEKDEKDKAGEYELIHVRVRTLIFILRYMINVDHIDFLTIDTEGTEMDILRGFDIEMWKPRIIVVENIEPENTEQFDYLKKRGYTLRKRINFNDIYERTDNDD